MKKNIWIWNHYATNMYSDKAGRHYWFAEHLIEKGYNPTIFCASTNHFTGENIDAKGNNYILNKEDKVPFVFVDTPTYIGNGKKRIKNMIAFYKKLFPVALDYAEKYEKPDIIYASSPHPLTMVAGILIAKKLRVPCVCEIRDLWPEAIFFVGKAKENSLLGKLLINGEHWIYKNADALVFLKEGDTEYLKEKKWTLEQGGDIDLNKCYYINNGVDIERFNKQIEEIQIDDNDLNDDSFKVVYAGSIRTVNNIGKLLDAAKLLKENKDIKFLIYGTGDELDFLKRRVKEENLTNVKLKGYVNKKYIPYILSKSSVNILNYSPTQYNWTRGNSSNKLFEYMASGKPIISTVKMGYCILEKYKCGFSLKESTPEELAKTILKVYNMPKNQYDELCTNAKESVKHFDYKMLTEKLIEVIESVK